MIITRTCRMCSGIVTMEVDEEHYDNYQKGAATIQECLPELTADEREIIISGICGTCFDQTFPE